MAGHGSKSWGESATAIEFKGRRGPTIATRGMVASSQTLASEAGLRILRAEATPLTPPSRGGCGTTRALWK